MEGFPQFSKKKIRHQQTKIKKQSNEEQIFKNARIFWFHTCVHRLILFDDNA